LSFSLVLFPLSFFSCCPCPCPFPCLYLSTHMPARLTCANLMCQASSAERLQRVGPVAGAGLEWQASVAGPSYRWCGARVRGASSSSRCARDAKSSRSNKR
jgi:hypothetical protein